MTPAFVFVTTEVVVLMPLLNTIPPVKLLERVSHRLPEAVPSTINVFAPLNCPFRTTSFELETEITPSPEMFPFTLVV